jgi:Mannosyltransferase (PIG-V)
MNPPDTSDTITVDTSDLLPLSARAAPSFSPVVQRAARRRGLRVRLDAGQLAAARDVARALALSRLLVWAVGMAAVLAVSWHVANAYDPPGITSGFGSVGDVLAAPAARWDTSWYAVIAAHGYHPELGLATQYRTAFFPLYPLLLSAFDAGGYAAIVFGGILVSLLALAFGLYGLHRLVSLETAAPHRWSHPDAPRYAVLLTAFAPMAFFFSAVYSESLYLALSVGVFWCARQGRWGWAGVLGALAAATRSAGVVLLVPMLILYFYGPRADRDPDRVAGRPWRPRYRVRPDLAWVALVPVGVLAYSAYIAASGGDAMLPFHAQDAWYRHFGGPFSAAKDGAVAAFDGVRQLLSGARSPVYWQQAGGSPFIAAGHNITLFAFLLLAVPALVGVFRRLPFAYGAYLIAALALPLSYPVGPQPLMSLPRFLVVLFPLNIWLAGVLAPRRRLRMLVLAGSALAMAVFTAQFTTWHWVA